MKIVIFILILMTGFIKSDQYQEDVFSTSLRSNYTHMNIKYQLFYRRTDLASPIYYHDDLIQSGKIKYDDNTLGVKINFCNSYSSPYHKIGYVDIADLFFSNIIFPLNDVLSVKLIQISLHLENICQTVTFSHV